MNAFQPTTPRDFIVKLRLTKREVDMIQKWQQKHGVESTPNAIRHIIALHLTTDGQTPIPH